MMAESCRRCMGCGRIADTPDGEPWIEWKKAAPDAAIAVAMGLVKPIPCPACHGTGKADGRTGATTTKE